MIIIDNFDSDYYRLIIDNGLSKASLVIPVDEHRVTDLQHFQRPINVGGVSLQPLQRSQLRA